MSRSPFDTPSWDRESEENDALASLDMMPEEPGSPYVPRHAQNRTPVQRPVPQPADSLADLDEPLDLPGERPQSVSSVLDARLGADMSIAPAPAPVSTRVAPEPSHSPTRVDPDAPYAQAAPVPAPASVTAKSPRQAPSGDTQVVEAIRRRPVPASAVPSKPYHDRDVPESESHFDRVADRAPHYVGKAMNLPGYTTMPLTLVIIALRLVAIALCAFIVILAVPVINNRLGLIEMTRFVSSLMPASLNGVLVLPTPFGGVFRGDFALAALALFIIDWFLTRLRERLRWR